MGLTYFSVLLRGLPQPLMSTYQMDPSKCVFRRGVNSICLVTIIVYSDFESSTETIRLLNHFMSRTFQLSLLSGVAGKILILLKEKLNIIPPKLLLLD